MSSSSGPVVDTAFRYAKPDLLHEVERHGTVHDDVAAVCNSSLQPDEVHSRNVENGHRHSRVQSFLDHSLFVLLRCSWNPTEQGHHSSCEAFLYRTLHTDRLGCWFPEGSHAPRPKINSCSLLHERHRQSDLPAIAEDRLRTCAGRVPLNSLPGRSGLCVRSRLLRPMVESSRHIDRATVARALCCGHVATQ